MRKICSSYTIIVLSFILAGCHGTFTSSPSITQLNDSVSRYYNYWIEKKYDKAFSFHANKDPKEINASVAYTLKFPITIHSYKIKSIDMENNEAIVTMELNTTLNDQDYVNYVIDRWEYIDSKWLITEGGKSPPNNEDTVKEFNWEEYKKQNGLNDEK